MQSFDTAGAITAAPQTVSDPGLEQLLADRVLDWCATGLLDLTHLLIIGPADTEQDIFDEVAFSPLVNPIDNARYGSKAFQPWWSWLERHDDWFELIVTVGNDGFAFELFIQDRPDVEAELLQLCREYAQ